MNNEVTYNVSAERDGKSWVLRVAELPGIFSQVRRLDQAEEWIRDAIALHLDVAEDSFSVEVTPVLEPDLQHLVDETLQLRALASRLTHGSNVRMARTVRVLLDGDLTVRDAGSLLDLSFQWVSQVAAKQPAGPYENDPDAGILEASRRILAQLEKERREGSIPAIW